MTDTEAKSTLGKSMASGAVWMVLFRLSERMLGLLSTIVLARLLLPEDFGLVAMAVTVIAFLEVFTMNDFASAIIQNQNAVREDYDTAWSMEVLLGFGAAISIALLAYPASIYFSDPRLFTVLLVLSVYPLLDGFYNVGCIDFRKYMQFEKDFIFQVTRKLSGVLICIPLAFMLRNHWALIGGMLAGRAGALVASYYLHPFRPRWSLKAAGRIWQFAKWIMVNNALSFLHARGAYLVLGRLGDPKALGLYTVAYDFANLPTSELAMPINRAVFPGYATIQADAERLKAGFLKVFAVITMVALPAGLGVAAISPTLVPLVLGQNWLEAIPLMQILAIGGAVSAMQANVESVYFAKGLTKIRAQVTAIQAAVMLPAMVWLVWKFGTIGAAWAFLLTSVVVAAFNIWRASRLLGVKAIEIWRSVVRPVIGSAMMVAAVTLLVGRSSETAGILSLTLHLFTQMILGALVYTLTVFLVWRLSGSEDGAEAWLLSVVRSLLRRFTNV